MDSYITQLTIDIHLRYATPALNCELSAYTDVTTNNLYF